MTTARLQKIVEIIRRGDGVEKRYKEVLSIVSEIRRSQIEGSSFNFTPTKKEISVQTFREDWGWWFGTRRIPFDDWSDICEEGLELTLKFIESDLEDYEELEGAKELVRKHFDRIDELEKSGKFTTAQVFAWNDMGY